MSEQTQTPEPQDSEGTSSVVAAEQAEHAAQPPADLPTAQEADDARAADEALEEHAADEEQDEADGEAPGRHEIPSGCGAVLRLPGCATAEARGRRLARRVVGGRQVVGWLARNSSRSRRDAAPGGGPHRSSCWGGEQAGSAMVRRAVAAWDTGGVRFLLRSRVFSAQELQALNS